MYDPERGRNRIVQAFSGLLSSSRHSYVQYVFSMDQESFIQSHIDMFKFFRGIPEYLTIDNLKTGVLKPDIYDPVLNPAYAEMAEHYDTFINPCRIADPQGKGKIERQIPVFRELFIRLKTLNPSMSINQLNREAQKICINELGMREHGTTGEAPYLKFKQEEKSLLKPLNDPFEIPHWKEAMVGPDQFLQFERRFFALPVIYIRKKVRICRIGKKVNIFHNNELIRQYVLNGDRKYFFCEDFPEGLNAIVEGSYADWLVKRASEYGKEACELIRKVLHPQAALNARRARGMLSIMEDFCKDPDFIERCRSAMDKKISTPAMFKKHLETDLSLRELKPLQVLSEQGRKMARSCEYYFS